MKTGLQRVGCEMAGLVLRADEASESEVTTFRITGYAVRWDDRYETDWMIEEVRRGAFPASNRKDVRLLTQHSSLPLARSKTGTLEIREDEVGLYFEAELDARDTNASDLRVKLEREDVNGTSVGFRHSGTEVRIIHPASRVAKVRRIIDTAGELRDISVVSFPAYPKSSVGLREEGGADDRATRARFTVPDLRARLRLARARSQVQRR